ncbi:hypothetical protein NQ117_06355 [Paenibacillus sp. SC116]|uniref:VOC family protein n=1 Tax=Paenibacillus sp. SC116 TaxID=2968986 RepID=UPI00215A2E13|nr:VOC family protein [Paenibacillus sp. SC116]MCR8843299.1 hypothetical protein [Paenibacillus sp. SC116]
MKIIKVEAQSKFLNEMQHFYHQVLGLELIETTASSFCVQIGSTALQFNHTEETLPSSYHFAINIPENQIDESLEFLQKAVTPIQADGQTIVHFEHWNAHSFYFFDPDGNILECIARHNLPNASNEKFSTSSYFNISEVGFPVRDVGAVVEKMKTELGEHPWQGQSDTFTAVGAEEGLIILVKEGRQWFMSDIIAAPLPVAIHIEDARGGSMITCSSLGEIKIFNSEVHTK